MRSEQINAVELKRLIRCGDVRFSQDSIGDHTRDGVYIGTLANEMRTHGWKGPPVNAVEIEKKIILLDHRRNLAAMLTNDKNLFVPIDIYGADDNLPDAGFNWVKCQWKGTVKGVDAVQTRMIGKKFKTRLSREKLRGFEPHEVRIRNGRNIMKNYAERAETERDLRTMGFVFRTSKRKCRRGEYTYLI